MNDRRRARRRRIPSAEHFEYRTLERATIDTDELNQLGLDGWELTAAIPSPQGVRMVLLRRL